MAEIKFHDGYWYCYANSTAMLLSSIDEDISPHLIEPLTGVGLGSFVSNDGLTFFSGLHGAPDKGISKALEILGFSFKENYFEEEEIDITTTLNEILIDSPAILGPLDMTYLFYNPKRPDHEGVDHYVLAYKLEDNDLFVYDPAGYARVTISCSNIKKAWKAEKISYKRGNYRYWSHPKRINKPKSDDIYRNAMLFFKNLYKDSEQLAKKENRLHDVQAIRELAKLVKDEKLTDDQIGFLSSFALPLGVKRAIDYSDFFRKFNSKLSFLKNEQSKLFGKAQSSLMNRNQVRLIDNLEKIAEVEEDIKNVIINYEA